MRNSGRMTNGGLGISHGFYSRSNYYLVLPWHFKKEILKREINVRKKGTKFIFPLPKLEIR